MFHSNNMFSLNVYNIVFKLNYVIMNRTQNDQIYTQFHVNINTIYTCISKELYCVWISFTSQWFYFTAFFPSTCFTQLSFVCSLTAISEEKYLHHRWQHFNKTKKISYYSCMNVIFLKQLNKESRVYICKIWTHHRT